MSARKGVVDVHVGHAREALDKLGVGHGSAVTLHARFVVVHAYVVEHQKLTRFEIFDGLHGLGPVDVVHPLDLTAEQATQFTGVTKRAREVVFSGARLVCQQDHLGFDQALKGRQNCSNSSVVHEGLRGRFKGTVDVHAQQHGFAVDVDVVQREDLGH